MFKAFSYLSVLSSLALSQHIQLNPATIKANSLDKYQSKNEITKQSLENLPTGNGDLTSLLKILPNINFDSALHSSNTPGEIDPANISISGGLFYQNSFLLDGFSINNDLDPNGATNNTISTFRGNTSQGLAIDASLLESISVQDSNIGASYGGFSGGVVEANTRNPREDGIHAMLSYQYTSHALTHYFIPQSQEEAFLTSSNENYQPKFSKHLIRSSFEGFPTKKLGLLASFQTTRSIIPLQAYANDFVGNYQKRDQKRQIDNYYLKAIYRASPAFYLQSHLAYAPQNNSYFDPQSKDSFYSIKSGGIQAGTKAILTTKQGVLTQNLSLSSLQSSRDSQKDYWIWWLPSADKNWAHRNNTRAPYAYEGGFGDIIQRSLQMAYQADFAFDELHLGKTAHNLTIGAQIQHQRAKRERLFDVYTSIGRTQNLPNGATCGPESFGFKTCSPLPPYSQPSWSGQYMKSLALYERGENAFGFSSYALFVEDDMHLGRFGIGDFDLRLGLRGEGDGYMQKKTLAPRTSLSYTIHPSQTQITLGANRYYGRNLLSYRLYDNEQNTQKRLSRNSPNEQWMIMRNTPPSSNVLFETLSIPYSDELSFAIAQKLSAFSIVAKYISRMGRDEIIRVQGKTAKPGYSQNYTTWSNQGKSQSHIVSLSVKNIHPIEWGLIQNFFWLSVDWTNTKRGYNVFGIEDANYQDKKIFYDGSLIAYQDRPVENFLRPIQASLNATHLFYLSKTQWHLNHFFSYRAPFSRIARNGNITIAGESYEKYDKRRFSSAFGWDMQVGFEKKLYKDQIIFANIDIFNVLNKQTITALSSTQGIINQGPNLALAVPVYERGRQFWLQMGYKF